MQQPVVVGVAGGSGAGKSTLVAQLVKASPRPVATLAFDNYYRCLDHLPMTERTRVNYDHPNSLDVERFVADLRSLRAGSPVATPVYDFTVHTRSSDVHLVEPRPVLVVDGILLYVFDEVCDLIDLRVFVEVADDVRTARRVERDIAERGRTAEYALAQIERTVRPMHGEFVQPSKERAHVVVDGTTDPSVSAHAILDRIGVATPLSPA